MGHDAGGSSFTLKKGISLRRIVGLLPSHLTSPKRGRWYPTTQKVFESTIPAECGHGFQRLVAPAAQTIALIVSCLGADALLLVLPTVYG